MKGFLMKLMFLAIPVWMFSCSESATEDAARTTIKMQGTLQSSSSSRVASDLNFSEVMIGVTKIELEHELEYDSGDDDGYDDNNDDSDDSSGDDDSDDYDGSDDFEVEIKGRYVVDLLDGTSSPGIPAISVTPGFYNEIKIELSPILDGGYSVILKGSYTDNQGVQRPVELMLKHFFELKIENHKGFDLDAVKLNQILVLFDLESWFSSVDMEALIDEDGMIRINLETHHDVSNQVKFNIEDHCRSGSDDDDDGKFDDD